MNKVYIFFAFVFVLSSPITLVSGINYGLYLLFVLFAFLGFFAKGTKFQIPKKYSRLFIFLLLILAINSLITPYNPSILQVLLGTAITCLPFFHYIISYNFKFSTKEVNTLMDSMVFGAIIVTSVCLVESVLNILEDSTGFIHSDLFAVGFVASFCNQAVALSLYRYKQTRERKHIKRLIFFVVFIVLTMQLKAISGCALIFIGYYYYTHSHKGIYVKIVALLILFISVLSYIPAFTNKVENYIEMYTSEGASEGIARNALYLTSGRIAVDYFPLGTGQGTFASVASKLSSSAVLDDYGIANVYGLNDEDSTQAGFLLDTHWANILGENGILGTLFYLILLFYPLYLARKNKTVFPVEFRFLTTLSILTIFIESFFLPLPNRINFIFIYSGLMAILYRKQLNEVK